jgi:TRAP-type C4-dicarboxylate transport system substrate-binding protein
MQKILLRTLIAGAMAGAVCIAQAQEVTLRVHHFLGPQSVQNTAMLGAWCDKLANESANRLKCQLYPAMQLGGSPTQLYDQAKDGIADVIWTIAGYSANRFPRMEVFELPFMMTNAEATSRAAWDYYSTHARDEFADTRILAVHVHGPGNLFTTRKKVEKLSDIKGLKLRAPTRLTNKMLAMMGATPVGMPVPAVPDALAKGLIDGAVLPYEVTPGIKVNELVKHAAEPDRHFNALYTAVFIVAMNKAKYESMPADLKKVMDANSGREFSAFLGKTQSAADTSGREKVLASGVQINVIPKAELDLWKKATDQLDDDWVENLTARGHNGKFLLQSARELITRYSK